jgi:tetratricopeptide (TPR) repeat protein
MSGEGGTTMKRWMARLATAAAVVALVAIAPKAAPAQESRADERPLPDLDDVLDEQQSAQERQQEAADRAQEAADRAQEALDELREIYDEATEDLDEGRLDAAIRRFEQVAAKKSVRADPALYWKAYAQYKRALKADALQTIERLRREHPQSRWLKEAQALEVEIRQRGGEKPDLDGMADDELKIMALSGLLNAHPEEALPLLEKLLNSAQSPRVREHALFVLSQSDSPQALEILARTARGQGSPALERKAIQYLGIHGGPDSRKLLAEVYAQSTDFEVRREVLEAFMICGEKARLLEVFKTEKNLELRSRVVEYLGAMGAVAELEPLYASETSREVKHAILEGLMAGDDAKTLVRLARAEKDRELRRKAVEMLSVMDAPEARQFLREILEK